MTALNRAKRAATTQVRRKAHMEDPSTLPPPRASSAGRDSIRHSACSDRCASAAASMARPSSGSRSDTSSAARETFASASMQPELLRNTIAWLSVRSDAGSRLWDKVEEDRASGVHQHRRSAATRSLYHARSSSTFGVFRSSIS